MRGYMLRERLHPACERGMLLGPKGLGTHTDSGLNMKTVHRRPGGVALAPRAPIGQGQNNLERHSPRLTASRGLDLTEKDCWPAPNRLISFEAAWKHSHKAADTLNNNCNSSTAPKKKSTAKIDELGPMANWGKPLRYAPKQKPGLVKHRRKKQSPQRHQFQGGIAFYLARYKKQNA